MISTTLCYIEQDGKYLMLLRNKKKDDLNEGKWIGVGGKNEPGETPDECVRRETKEETGLTLRSVRLRGVIEFISEKWEDEHMYLYTSSDFEGELTECDEGELAWIPKSEIFRLPLWEGDKVFFNYLLADEPFFHLELRYDERDELVQTRRLPNLILASQSPRRRDLMEQIGLMPVVYPAEVEEQMKGTSPEEIVKGLALQKAEAVASQFSHGEIVLGADTVVAAEGNILGKPQTHEEAAEMIRMLSGKTHQVYTGVTIIRCGDCGEERSPVRKSFAARTDVHVYPMTEEEIGLYAESEEPMDKAGAYGIQGPFAAFVKGIEGEYANVVGLPVARVYQELKELLREEEQYVTGKSESTSGSERF